MTNILIVDDEPCIRTLLRRFLEMEGHTVSEATDGDEALKAYRADPADLVLMDIVMPGKEGIETIMQMCREFPQAKIVAISGGGLNRPQNYLQIAEQLGAKRTLTKPFSREELLAAVRELL